MDGKLPLHLRKIRLDRMRILEGQLTSSMPLDFERALAQHTLGCDVKDKGTMVTWTRMEGQH